MLDRRLVIYRLMAAEMVVVGVGGQPALRAELTAVPCFVEPADLHRLRLKRLFNDVPLGVVEFAVEIRTGEGVR